MAGMIWDGTYNFVQTMPRYLHKIERLYKLLSVPLSSVRGFTSAISRWHARDMVHYNSACSEHWTAGDSAVAVCIEVGCLCVEQYQKLLLKKHLHYFTALLKLKKILQTKRNKKKEWTKSWFVRSQGSSATICKKFTFKRTQRILQIGSGCQSNFSLLILLSKKQGMLEEF